MDDTRLAFTRRGYPDVDRKTCADCGTVYYSAGAHLERCPGPRRVTDRLFDPAYSEPVDTTGQVTRIPGTADAACMCGQDVCRWPFDKTCWPTNEQEDDA